MKRALSTENRAPKPISSARVMKRQELGDSKKTDGKSGSSIFFRSVSWPAVKCRFAFFPLSGGGRTLH
jgi:hypothetical protein